MEPQVSTSCALNILSTDMLLRILLTYAREEFNQWCRLIHFICVSLGGREPPFGFLPNPITHIVKLVMVCRTWRTLALNHGPIWSNIAIRSGTITPTAMLLERSKQSPLDICYVLSTRRPFDVVMDEHLSLVLREVGRIRSFQLYHRDTDDLPAPSDFPLYGTLHAPLLESLSVVQFGYNIGTLCSGSTVLSRVGETWSMPRLRRYSVKGGKDVRWTSGTPLHLHLSETLTHLTWRPSSLSSPFAPSADIVISALRHLPHLHTLRITVANRIAVDLPERSFIDHVVLPKLRSLLLEGNIQICVDVLGRIEYPEPLEQLTVIAGWGEEGQLPESIMVHDYLAESIQGDVHTIGVLASNPGVHRPMLLLGIHSDDNIPDVTRIVACQEMTGPRCIPSWCRLDTCDDDLFYEIGLSLTLPKRLPREHLDLLFGGVVLQKVKMLYFHVGAGKRISDAWLKTASLLTEVHTLEMGNSITPEMVAAVLVPRGDRGGGITHSFPRLKVVRLHGLHPDPSQRSGDLRGTYCSLASSLLLLIRNTGLGALIYDCLVPRTAARLGIRQLDIRESRLKVDDVMILRGIVPRVLWDGFGDDNVHGSLKRGVLSTIICEGMKLIIGRRDVSCYRGTK